MNSKPEEQASAVPVIAGAVRLVSTVVDQAIVNFVAQLNAVGVTSEDLLLASAEIQETSTRDV